MMRKPYWPWEAPRDETIDMAHHAALTTLINTLHESRRISGEAMNPLQEHSRVLTRRQLLGQTGLGARCCGAGHLASGSSQHVHASPPDPTAPTLPHFAPKAKRVIYLFQNGGPSHVDLFDYKPKLRELEGKGLPAELTDGKRFSTMTATQTKNFCAGDHEIRPAR